MRSNFNEDDESRNFLLEMRVLAAIGCLLILLYSLRFWASGQLLRILGLGMLVAGAALLSGFLLGFIFAIPRVGDKKGSTTAAKPEPGEEQASVPFNANLVEISDWLTKIIVGVGLVELHSIPGRLGKMSYYLGPGLQPAPCAGGAPCVESLASGQAAGLAILIFYFTLGFLLGYVWTMVYFQRDLMRDLKRQKRVKQAAVLIMTAEASIAEGKLVEAMASIDEAIENDPQNGFAVMTKARVLKRQALQPGRPDRDNLLKQALAYLDQAIARLPDKYKGEPVYNKACYQALLGLKSEALESLKSAFRLNPALRRIAKRDDDLASLKQDADFDKLIGQDEPPDA